MSIGILEHRDIRAGRQTVWYCDDCTKIPTTAWSGLAVGDIIEVVDAGIKGSSRLFCASVSPLVIGSASGFGLRTVTGSATLAAVDRFLLDNASGTITLQTSSLYPVGAPYTVRLGASSLTLTVTPTSGVFYTATGATAAGASITTAPVSFITNGTDWFIV